MVEEKEGFRNRLQTGRETRGLIMEFYQGMLKAKKEGKPIIWIPPLGGIAEILYAMDVQPVIPEHFGPLCAAMNLAPKYFEASEARGYSRDLCGYLRAELGYLYDSFGKKTLFDLPKPDLLIAFVGCMSNFKTWQGFQDFFQVPTFWMDQGVFGGPGGLIMNAEAAIEYGVLMFRRIVSFIEKYTGRKLDEDRLKEVAKLSDRASELFGEIQDFRKIVPAPYTMSDISIMFPMVALTGTQKAVDFLTKVRDEVKERVEQGIGAIENERFRLLWDNVPIWHNIKLFHYFEQKGAAVVADTYTRAWTGRIDITKPIESAVKKVLLPVAVLAGIPTLDRKIDWVLRMVRSHHIDGA
ncbi:MAG TPA: 2-hydroxyacyl-CoA dehydratase family protein, partial [Candidatus Deferrimicrobium sp.]|nr:2-hydroxyacyl-CoA dehydratase family protein [Candidatus Deferrimicrobium sp.]